MPGTLSDDHPAVQLLMEALMVKDGGLSPAEQQGLIICLTNELGVKRQTLTHGFDPTGLFTALTKQVQEITSDDATQVMLYSCVLRAVMEQFLATVDAAAAQKLSQAA